MNQIVVNSAARKNCWSPTTTIIVNPSSYAGYARVAINNITLICSDLIVIVGWRFGVADQGIWFKLHCSAMDDPDLDNLDLADFGRWAKLGAFVKRQGTAGTVLVTPPARALCAILQLPSYTALLELVTRLPHMHIEERQNCNGQGVTGLAVTFQNWRKYQGDFSGPRVAKFREMKRSKRRGEENKKRVPPDISLAPVFLETLRKNPAYNGIDLNRELSKMDAWLSTPAARGRKKTKRFVVNWLNRIDVPLPVGKSQAQRLWDEAQREKESGP